MKKKIFCLNILFMAVVALMACGPSGTPAPSELPATVTTAPTLIPPTSPPATEKKIITVWFNAGVGNALKAMELNIQDFHNDQDIYEVEMTLVPEGAYTDRILAAGQTGELPCLLFLMGQRSLTWPGSATCNQLIALFQKK